MTEQSNRATSAREARRRDSRQGKGPQGAASAEVERARDLEASGDVAGAEAAYRRRLVEDPGDLAARVGLARIYGDRGDHRLALEQYEAAQTSGSEVVDVLIGLGATLLALGRFDAAERPLRRAQRIRPQNAEVYLNLGLLHFKRGRLTQAETDLERAIGLDPDNTMAYFYRGEALNQLGRVDEALGMLERVVAREPWNSRAYYTMGILYDRKNLRTEAAAMYRKAREATAS